MERCGEPRLDKVWECFPGKDTTRVLSRPMLKETTSQKCLAICIKGRLFYMGLPVIQWWQRNRKGAIKESGEIQRIKQNLLEGCAHYSFGGYKYITCLKCNCVHALIFRTLCILFYISFYHMDLPRMAILQLEKVHWDVMNNSKGEESFSL